MLDDFIKRLKSIKTIKIFISRNTLLRLKGGLKMGITGMGGLVLGWDLKVIFKRTKFMIR